MQQNTDDNSTPATTDIKPSNDEATGKGTGSAPGSYGGPADVTEDAYPTSDEPDATGDDDAAKTN